MGDGSGRLTSPYHAGRLSVGGWASTVRVLTPLGCLVRALLWEVVILAVSCPSPFAGLGVKRLDDVRWRPNRRQGRRPDRDV